MKLLDNALETANGLSIALLIHKPLFICRDNEAGRSLGSIWPPSRKRLLSLCKQYNVKLVASGHRHCYRTMRYGPTRLIWAPPTSFIDTRAPNIGGPVERRVGFVRYRFDSKKFDHEFVEPSLFINHDMRNWMAAHGSTTRLPPRPIALHEC